MVASAFDTVEQRDGFIPSAANNSGLPSIRLISGKELARELLFEGTTSSFRKFCREAGIEPVPGRKDGYDPIAVRHKLNEIQGLNSRSGAASESALTRSRMRRNG